LHHHVSHRDDSSARGATLTPAPAACGADANGWQALASAPRPTFDALPRHRLLLPSTSQHAPHGHQQQAQHNGNNAGDNQLAGGLGGYGVGVAHHGTSQKHHNSNATESKADKIPSVHAGAGCNGSERVAALGTGRGLRRHLLAARWAWDQGCHVLLISAAVSRRQPDSLFLRLAALRGHHLIR